MANKNRSIFILIGLVVSLILVLGIVFLNISDKNSTLSNKELEKDMDVEKENKANIPAIKVNENKDYPESRELGNESADKELEIEIDEYKETIENNTKDDKNTNINPITKQVKNKLPEEMEKPITEAKPIEQPKPLVEETKDKDKAPTTKEEPKQEVKGGTGEDGVVRDLKGNSLQIEGNPNGTPNEVKGSDLLPEGENMGEGDKF